MKKETLRTLMGITLVILLQFSFFKWWLAILIISIMAIVVLAIYWWERVTHKEEGK